MKILRILKPFVLKTIVLFKIFWHAPFQSVMQLIIFLLQSAVTFVKASFLSLVVIAIIFLLMTKLSQGLTMIVEMVEKEYLALLISLAYINVLGLMLSHYPVYTYFAGNLNGSKDYYIWKRHAMFGPILKWFPVYTFEKNPNPAPHTRYKVNHLVHIFRYLLGFLIYAAWTHILINSFSSNIEFYEHKSSYFYWLAHGSSAIPFLVYLIFYGVIKQRKDHDHKIRVLKTLTYFYFVFVLIGIGLIALLAFIPIFGLFGLSILLALNFVMLLNFVFFRLLRNDFGKVETHFNEHNNILLKIFLLHIRLLSKSENYLRFFMLGFLVSLGFVLYCIIVGTNGGDLMNGFPILLAYLYCYTYIIASLNKFFFVCQRKSSESIRVEGAQSRLYKFTFYGLVILGVSFIFRFKTTITTHQLEQVPWQASTTDMSFADELMERSDTLFFISSHGGGLKADVWTLKVLFELDRHTQGEMMRRSVAMSGASGGSLGLAQYIAISGECEANDLKGIRKRIAQISKGNYTSIDLTMMLGPDFFRKLFPLNVLGGSRDRSYHSMVRYQNYVEGYDHVENNELCQTPFRNYWEKAYNSRKHLFPCLIMNTAATNGQRGIIWSLQSDHFNRVFPNAQNLGDLYGGTKTLNYYQAVSMTERFPVFSPAAKIKNYGHYADAGIIDNSGLLGCMDYYTYLMSHPRYKCKMKKKHVVFVEIVNSRSIYIRQFIENFEDSIGYSIRFKVHESPNVVTDFKTALNVDKIPDYMSYMLKEKDRREANFDHIRILLPHRISLEDVEEVLGGELDGEIVATVLDELNKKIREHNRIIHAVLDEKPGRYGEWHYLEPELSRHFSPSNLRYVNKILEHPNIRHSIREVCRLAPCKRN